MREGAAEGSRPNIGRKKKSDTKSDPDPSVLSDGQNNTEAVNVSRVSPVNKNCAPKKTAKIQTSVSSQAPDEFSSSAKTPHPDYLAKGPLITRQMFNQWSPEMFKSDSSRPIRSTRNPKPNYVEAIAA